jgi:membrane protein CcdC involved in cytochrome C biogenesis
MAKIEKSKLAAKKGKKEEVFPLQRENFIIMGIGLLVIILGYIALSGNQVEGFSQLTLAPILLVLGYCVIIPIGIMYRKKPKSETTSPPTTVPK